MNSIRILQWNFSEKFSYYLQWFRSVSDKEVRFFYTDEHPDSAVHMRQAMVEIKRSRAFVYILRGIDRDLAEENAAHELAHLALMEMGYCYPGLTARQGSQWQQVVSAILSWTSDVLIDKLLEGFGYDNKKYQYLVWENTMHHLKLYPQESQPGAEEIFNALGYFYCYHSVEREKWEEMKNLYSKVDPRAFLTGERIIAISESMDFSKKEGYCSFLQKLRDELALAEIVTILDPETGKIY